MPWWGYTLIGIGTGAAGFLGLLLLGMRDYEDDKAKWYRDMEKKEKRLKNKEKR